MTVDKTIRRGKATLKLEGFDDLFRRLDRVGGDAQKAAVEVFGGAAKRVFAKSQSRVPVDKGNLKKSGRITKPRVNKKGLVTASVTYGGAKLKRLAPNEPFLYALAVHEDPSGPGFKFLEIPMVAEKSAVMRELERRIAGKLEKG